MISNLLEQVTFYIKNYFAQIVRNYKRTDLKIEYYQIYSGQYKIHFLFLYNQIFN